MNALILLRNDHRRVDRLVAEHKQASGNARRQKAIFDEIHRELDVHAQMEETVFYPAMEGGLAVPVREQMEEARAEHEEVKALLKQLVGLAPEDAGYAVAFTNLVETVRRHVAEEEGAIFAAARQCFSYDPLIWSTAVRMSSIVEKANNPSPVGNALPKPVSCVTTGRPQAKY